MAVDAQLRPANDWVLVTGRFSGVCYFKFVSDVPAVLGENEVDYFAQKDDIPCVRGSRILTESEKEDLSRVMKEGTGWVIDARPDGMTYVATDMGASGWIGSPGKGSPNIRRFQIQSSFISAEWLCTEAVFDFTTSPTGQAPSASGNETMAPPRDGDRR